MSSRFLSLFQHSLLYVSLINYGINAECEFLNISMFAPNKTFMMGICRNHEVRYFKLLYDQEVLQTTSQFSKQTTFYSVFWQPAWLSSHGACYLVNWFTSCQLVQLSSLIRSYENINGSNYMKYKTWWYLQTSCQNRAATLISSLQWTETINTG